MVHPAQGAIQTNTQHVCGHPLRGGSGPRARHGRSGAHGARHELRGGRRTHQVEETRGAQLQAARVPREVPAQESTQVPQQPVLHHVKKKNMKLNSKQMCPSTIHTYTQLQILLDQQALFLLT